MKRILFLIIILFLFSGIALGTELGAGDGTGYPAAIDTDTNIEIDYPSPLATTARSAVPNDTNAAVIAIETELGINPSGAYDTLKARLDAGDGLYYLKTEIDSLSEVEDIYVKDIIDSDELAALKFTDLADTPAAYTGSSLKFARVNAGETALEFATLDLSLYYLKTEINTQTLMETIWGVSLANDSELHAQNTDTDLDPTFEATFVKKADNVNVLNDITSPGVNIEDAVTKRHTQNTDTQLDLYSALFSDHTWTGEKDLQPVGETVVFGDLLYPDWTAGEWLKADADLAAKMPGLRIALEDKTDGQACLMLVKGYIRDDSTFEFTASMVYTSVTPGAMSSTAPTESGDQLQRVGVAKSADILFFDPSIDVGEIKP